MQLALCSLGDWITDPVSGDRMSVRDKHLLTIDSAVTAESAGLSGMYVGEHHGLEYVFSSPPVILSAIAQRTSTLRLGTAVTLLANLDPVRVAEDYATVDLLSDGRVELIGGRGNLFASTYTLFGQQLDDSVPRFEEALRLLMQLWTDTPTNWTGSFRPAIKDLRLQPAPIQKPHPPIWVGGGLSPASAELSARLGLPLMLPVVTFQPAKTFASTADLYRRCWQESGHESPCQIGAVFHAFVGKTSQETQQRFAPRYTAYHDFAVKTIANAGTPTPPFMYEFDFDAVVGPEGAAIAGSPEQVVDRIGSLTELLGLNTVLLYLDLGGLPRNELLDMVELVGSEVLPRLGSRSSQRV